MESLQSSLARTAGKLDEWSAPVIDLLTKYGRLTESQARVALGLAGAGASVWLLWKMMVKNKYNFPPGPRPLPLVGNVREMNKDKRFYMVLDKLYKDYGPVATLYIGPKPNVIISSASVLRDAWIKDGLTYAMRIMDNATDLFTSGGKDMFGAVHYDTRLQMQRKLAFAALRNYASGEALEEHVYHAFEQLCVELDKPSSGEIDAVEAIYFLTYNLLASMCFSSKFKAGDPFIKKIMELQKEQNEIFNDPFLFFVTLVDWFKYLPFKVFKVLRKFRDTWGGYIDENYEKHMEQYNPDNVSDFAGFVIHEMKQMEKDENERNKLKALTEDNFKFILFDLFLAGTETTRMTLTWVWYYLAAHPEIQKRVQQEVDDVLGPTGRVTTKSRESLPFVDAVLHEVMRIRPVAPMTIKQTSQDANLAGYHIPKGTLVWSNAYSMHFDEKEWDEPYTFKPDRWIDPNTGKYLYQQNGFIPFSVGRRSCIGEGFAKLELHMLVTLMIQRYTFKPKPGSTVDLEPVAGFDMQPKEQILIAEKRV